MTHDPVSEFVYALALVLIFNLTGIVSRTITLYWRIYARGVDVSRVAASAGIGIVEQTLYIYCLSSTHREFIGSVLLFKAFYTWLSLSPPAPTTPTATGTTDGGTERLAIQKNDPARPHRNYLLELFYAYAIGNFVSLSYAIFFYEIVHLWLIRILPALPLEFLHS